MAYNIGQLSDAQIEALENQYDEMGDELPGVDQYTRCEICGVRYPSDDDYWYFLDDTLQQPCKECHRKQAEEKHEQKLIQAAQTTAAVLSQSTVDRIVGGEVMEISGIEHLTDVVVDQFAGPQGIAKMLWNEYHEEKPRLSRIRILELITRMVKQSDEQRSIKDRHDGGLVTDDDIRAVLMRIAPQMAQPRISQDDDED